MSKTYNLCIHGYVQMSKQKTTENGHFSLIEPKKKEEEEKKRKE